MNRRLTFWLAFTAMLGLLAAESSTPAATRLQYTPRCYQRSAAPAARPNVQSTRRYSFTPGGYSSGTSYSRSSSGRSGSYRPGSPYSPSRGINSADFKIKGL